MSICLPHHWAHWLVIAIVGLWVVPGIMLRWSPAVLALGWASAEDYSCRIGQSMPVEYRFAIDIISIAAILALAWPIWQPASRREAAILAIFPFMWPAYFMTDPYWRWWALWALAIMQFILAGPWPFILKNRTKEFRRGFTIGRPVRTKGG